MPNAIKAVVATVLLIGASFCQATNYCVVPVNAGATPPYTDWAMAATNIQEVVNGCLAGDTIYLTNGHYYLTGEVVIATAVTVKSYNCGAVDPTNTILDGNNYAGKPVTNRCLNITNAATIDGLTITNGVRFIAPTSIPGGGGCYIVGNGVALLTNCIITGNTVTNYQYAGGGGVLCAKNAIIANCQIVGNYCSGWGAGVEIGLPSVAAANFVVTDSLIGWNDSPQGGSGVALVTSRGALVKNCTIVSNKNSAVIFLWNAFDAVVSNCVIRGNTNGTPVHHDTTYGVSNSIVNCKITGNYSTDVAGGYVIFDMLYRNCLIASNYSSGVYGGLCVPANATGRVESCTVVGNRGASYGGVYAGGGSKGFFYNTIISSNRLGSTFKDLSLTDADATNRFFNCCCPTNSLPPAQGNIPSLPLFVDVNADNYRLSPNSPCINAGLNQYWMTNAFDLDGNRRLDQLNGRVDMGAYEFIHTITLITGH